jgi:hypothetical protein
VLPALNQKEPFRLTWEWASLARENMHWYRSRFQLPIPVGWGKFPLKFPFPRSFFPLTRSSRRRLPNPCSSAGENVLRIELSSSSPFPQGELIQLQFDLSQEAQPNQEFDVKNLGQRGETPQGEALEARGSDGLIIVAIFGEAIPACFFYMH